MTMFHGEHRLAREPRPRQECEAARTGLNFLARSAASFLLLSMIHVERAKECFMWKGYGIGVVVPPHVSQRPDGS